MNSSTQEQSLNDYTEIRAFTDSLRRMGRLFLPAIVTLLIPTSFGIFYLFHLLSLPTAVESKNIANQYIAQGVGVMFAPLILMIVILVYIFKSSGNFLKTFHNLPDSTDVKQLVRLRVLGIIPTPPPLDKVIKFPVLTVKDGKLDPPENWHTNIGGPVKLKIESGNAVYLERGNHFSRVVGQGNQFMELHEKIKAVFSVGPQSKDFEVSAWTRDGIKIDLKAKGEYFLGAANQGDDDVMVPFDAAAARNAVEQTLIGGKEGGEWVESAVGKTKGALNGYISKRHLEEIFLENEEGGTLFSQITMNNLLADVNNSLKNSGARLSHFQVTNAIMDPEITDQRIETWKTAHNAYELVTESDARAQLIRAREKARAEMQRDLIYALADGLDRIDAERFPEPLFLSISALLDQSMNNPDVRATLAKESLETLEKTQEALKFNLQLPGEET